MSQSDGVAVCVVTHNSAGDLPGCLAAIAEPWNPPVAQLVVVDCASSDDSVSVVERLAPTQIPLILERSEKNLGFAGGMNLAIRLSSAPFILSLNPDTRPAPDYCSRLLATCNHPRLPRWRPLTGRLARPAQTDGSPPRLDACGMKLIVTWRHLDRASGEIDRGQFGQPERVFGATGAATLYRRAPPSTMQRSTARSSPPSFPLLQRGRRTLLPPARAGLGDRSTSQPPWPCISDIACCPARRRQMPAEHQLPLAQEPLPAARLPSDGRQPAADPLPHSVARLSGLRSCPAVGAQLTRRLSLVVAPSAGDS